MQAQWNAQGAQRRRRILIDDASTPEATKSKATQESAANDSDSQRDRARRSYEPLALDGQPRVTDLIPRRIWVLALFMLVWLLLISGIVFLHLQLDRWSVVVGNGGLSALDLSGFAGPRHLVFVSDIAFGGDWELTGLQRATSQNGRLSRHLSALVLDGGVVGTCQHGSDRMLAAVGAVDRRSFFGFGTGRRRRSLVDVDLWSSFFGARCSPGN